MADSVERELLQLLADGPERGLAVGPSLPVPIAAVQFTAAIEALAANGYILVDHAMGAPDGTLAYVLARITEHGRRVLEHAGRG